MKANPRAKPKSRSRQGDSRSKSPSPSRKSGRKDDDGDDDGEEVEEEEEEEARPTRTDSRSPSCSKTRNAESDVEARSRPRTVKGSESENENPSRPPKPRTPTPTRRKGSSRVLPRHFPAPRLVRDPTGQETPPISLITIEPVAKECFRRFGESAILRLSDRIRHVFAPNVLMTALMKTGGDNPVELLIEIAEKYDVYPALLAGMVAAEMGDDDFETSLLRMKEQERTIRKP